MASTDEVIFLINGVGKMELDLFNNVMSVIVSVAFLYSILISLTMVCFCTIIEDILP